MKLLLLRRAKVLDSPASHSHGVLDMHGSPAKLVVRRFQIERHSRFKWNIRCIREKRIVNFFRGAADKRKFPRFKADRMANKEIRVVWNSSGAHALHHCLEERRGASSRSHRLYSSENSLLHSVIPLFVCVIRSFSNPARPACVGIVTAQRAAHIHADNVPLL